MLLGTAGVRELDTGLAPPDRWDLPSDKYIAEYGVPLQVTRCTRIIPRVATAGVPLPPPVMLQPGQLRNVDEQEKYVISISETAKFVVGLSLRILPTDIEEGMRVGWAPCFWLGAVVLEANSDGAQS